MLGTGCKGSVYGTVQLSESHPTQAASPPTYKIRKKEERNGGREGGRTNTGDTSLSAGARRRPAARLIVSSVAAATKECRLPHPYPRRLITIISPKVFFMAEKTEAPPERRTISPGTWPGGFWTL